MGREVEQEDDEDPNEASERLIMSSSRKIAQIENMLSKPIAYTQENEPRDFQQLAALNESSSLGGTAMQDKMQQSQYMDQQSQLTNS